MTKAIENQWQINIKFHHCTSFWVSNAGTIFWVFHEGILWRSFIRLLWRCSTDSANLRHIWRSAFKVTSLVLGEELNASPPVASYTSNFSCWTISKLFMLDYQWNCSCWTISELFMLDYQWTVHVGLSVKLFIGPWQIVLPLLASVAGGKRKNPSI